MATLNIGMKVNRAITGATTVNSNAYAIVDYRITGISIVSGSQRFTEDRFITRYFGPGQSIPATIVVNNVTSTAGDVGNVTYTLQSGVEIINTQ